MGRGGASTLSTEIHWPLRPWSFLTASAPALRLPGRSEPPHVGCYRVRRARQIVSKLGFQPTDNRGKTEQNTVKTESSKQHETNGHQYKAGAAQQRGRRRGERGAQGAGGAAGRGLNYFPPTRHWPSSSRFPAVFSQISEIGMWSAAGRTARARFAAPEAGALPKTNFGVRVEAGVVMVVRRIIRKLA